LTAICFYATALKEPRSAGLDRAILDQARFDTQNPGLCGHLERAFQTPEVAKIDLILAGGRIPGGGEQHHNSLLALLHGGDQLDHAIEFLVFFIAGLCQKKAIAILPAAAGKNLQAAYRQAGISDLAPGQAFECRQIRLEPGVFLFQRPDLGGQPLLRCALDA